MIKIKDPKLFNSYKQYFTNYLPNVRAKSLNTITAYQFAINLYNEFIMERDQKELYEITTEDYNAQSIIGYMDWLEKSRSNVVSTINQRLAEIKAFCKFLMKDDPMLIGELSKIQEITKRPNPAKKTLLYLTQSQLELLFQQPDSKTKTGLRDKFYLELMYDSGCRDQEILDLQVKDFVIEKNNVYIRVIGKGSKFRVTPISEKLLPIYNDYRDKFLIDADPTDLIFYTVRQGIKTKMSDDNVARFMKKYEVQIHKTDPGFPHLHPHLLRHSRAMNLYINGMPLPLISEWLGHTQLETTTIYAQATTEMKRKASEKADAQNASIFTDEVFKYADSEEHLKLLYGLK